jgi:cysteine desulfurase / selenocysteine lyase
MSTSDPGTSERRPVERAALSQASDTGVPTGESPSLGTFALPDPAVITRLANEFFAALPASTSLQGLDASVPPRVTPGGVPAVPSVVPSPPAEVPANPQGFAQPFSEIPQSPAVPGSTGYFFDRTSPLNATPSFPSLNDAFSFPGVPGAQAMPGIPGIPGMPAATPGAPLTESELHAIPASLGNVPPFAPSISTSSLPTADSSAYFLDFDKAAPLATAPSFPDVAGMFSFPSVPSSGVPAGMPGMQSVPGVPVLPSSLPTDARALPDAALAPAPPGTTAYSPGGESKSAAGPLSIASFEFRPDVVPDMGLAARPFDPHFIRRDFPILQEQVNGCPLVWLDNAATTQKPNAVIDRVSSFYRHENSNIHRAAHTLAARATDAYEGAREKVRRFMNASSTREIVFVRGATEGINLVAKSWGHRNVQKDDEIVITWLEHHANIVPWQQLCAEKSARLRVAPVNDRGEVILEEYEKLLGPRTRIVAFSQVSNALGTITPAKEMIEMAHRHGAKVLLDGAQSIAHMGIDVQLLDCDFFVFSGHKIFAPTGIGVVFGKADIMDNTPPWQGGGNMIMDVTFEKTIYNLSPARFEAGTGNIADAVGLGAALDYLDQIGMENIARYEHDLLTYATAGLLTVPGLHLIGTAKDKAGVLSFVLDGFRTEDVGKALNQEGIAVRAGHHCAQPILRRFGVETTVRPSLALYNTCEDVDALIAALLRIQAGRGHRGL